MLRRNNRMAPLYYQVQHIVRQRILSGEYVPGSKIPTENKLSREMGVCRMTIREALRDLVDEKTLVRMQGRGTFVTQHAKDKMRFPKLSGPAGNLRKNARRIAVMKVDISRVRVTEEMGRLFSLDSAISELMRIKQLRVVKGQPYSYAISFLPTEIGKRIRKHDLYCQSPVQILEQQLKIKVSRIHETAEAQAADPEIAEKLDIPALSPIMHIKRVLYTKNNQPLEDEESYYRADEFLYSMDFVRTKSKGKASWRSDENQIM
jgi:GntR family transcriptional regulator